MTATAARTICKVLTAEGMSCDRDHHFFRPDRTALMTDAVIVPSGVTREWVAGLLRKAGCEATTNGRRALQSISEAVVTRQGDWEYMY